MTTATGTCAPLRSSGSNVEEVHLPSFENECSVNT